MGKWFLGALAAVCITFVGGGVANTSYAAKMPCYAYMTFDVTGTATGKDTITFSMKFDEKGRLLGVYDKDGYPYDIGGALGGTNCQNITGTLKIKKKSWVCKYECENGRAEINLKFSGESCSRLKGFISVVGTKYTLTGVWVE